MSLPRDVPSAAIVQGISIQQSRRDAPSEVLALQYSDRKGEWFQLEMPIDQALRLLGFLEQFRERVSASRSSANPSQKWYVVRNEDKFTIVLTDRDGATRLAKQGMELGARPHRTRQEAEAAMKIWKTRYESS